MGDRTRPQTNRAVLGVLLAFLFIAILLALWSLLFRGDDSTTASAGNSDLVAPTPLTIATATPVPPATTPTVTPTTAPVATATSVPEGFEACDEARAPLATATYIVDTNTTPLNQRSEPSVNAPQSGTFDPGQSGLVFDGDCVVNLADGYVWWQINNGTNDVWIASSFVSPN